MFLLILNNIELLDIGYKHELHVTLLGQAPINGIKYHNETNSF